MMLASCRTSVTSVTGQVGGGDAQTCGPPAKSCHLPAASLCVDHAVVGRAGGHQAGRVAWRPTILELPHVVGRCRRASRTRSRRRTVVVDRHTPESPLRRPPRRGLGLGQLLLEDRHHRPVAAPVFRVVHPGTREPGRPHRRGRDPTAHRQVLAARNANRPPRRPAPCEPSGCAPSCEPSRRCCPYRS